MNLLLDSHVFEWWCEGSPKLSRQVREAVAMPDNEVHVSLVMAWELAIKESLARLRLPEPFEAMLKRAGFALLPIDLEHVRRVTRLPFHHRDPFDRMLVAQAQHEAWSWSRRTRTSRVTMSPCSLDQNSGWQQGPLCIHRGGDRS